MEKQGIEPGEQNNLEVQKKCRNTVSILTNLMMHNIYAFQIFEGRCTCPACPLYISICHSHLVVF
jgi:hypothetical protein